MERHLNKKMNLKGLEKHRRSKAKRSVAQCNLEQCQDYRMASMAYQNQLQDSLAAAREKATHSQNLIIAYQR